MQLGYVGMHFVHTSWSHLANKQLWSTNALYSQINGSARQITNNTLEIKEFRCYEAKREESEKVGSCREFTQDTSGLNTQCSATELQQPDNYQSSQSSICTAQVVLNALVAHLAATQYVPSEIC